MDNPIKLQCQNMLNVLNDVKKFREQRDGIVKGTISIQNKDAEIKKINDNVRLNLEKINQANSIIFNLINGASVTQKTIQAIPTVPKPAIPQPMKSIAVPQPASVPKPAAVKQAVPVVENKPQPVILSPELASQKFKRLSENQKDKYIKDLNIDFYQLEDFLKYQKNKENIKTEIKKEDYTLYTPKDEAVLANKYAKKYADELIRDHPGWFEMLFTQYKKVNMQYLSRSYVSMIIFYSVCSIPAAFIFMIFMKFFFTSLFSVSWAIVILLTFLLPVIILIGAYFYPGSLIEDRAKNIKNELPFALIHMSAVAGSGAHPISIFELLAESNDYPELKKEIRKVLNYVNLFGYNLSTALRNTATTTPSNELKELLNGMVSTIETGGDLKSYLKSKAETALNGYRMDRKKKVEALGTYSEIYTSILIASPLLMVVTLAIMNSITGSIGGMSISTVAYLGVGLGLPLLNVGFIVFLKMQTGEM